MKHEGSAESFEADATAAPFATAQAWPPLYSPASQSLLSKLVVLTICLLLIAVIADRTVQTLALTLDPSARAVLLFITRFGNSAWPLGIGIFLLGSVELLRRSKVPVAREDLGVCRAVLILLVASVGISGVLSSLAKHVIGRIRPSTEPDAMVLEFSFMAFRSGWAAFPSGHATTAMAAVVTLALCFPRQAWGWVALGCVAALSRAFLGVHWLSDCLAGMMFGAAVSVAIYRRMASGGCRFAGSAGAFARIATSGAALLRQLAAQAIQRMR